MNTSKFTEKAKYLTFFKINYLTYYLMRFCTTLLSYPSQSSFPVRVSSVYNTGRDFSWPSQCCSYIWSTSAPVCHHLKIISHVISNIAVRNFEVRIIYTLPWIDVACITSNTHLRKLMANYVVVEI